MDERPYSLKGILPEILKTRPAVYEKTAGRILFQIILLSVPFQFQRYTSYGNLC